ncbi:glutamyl-tRNA synthetase [Paenibacillus sp. UNCCL117]|uniref:tRNA glutamyl-Q(34) synthetase GluQRS n=1 Tax=unclassified Paenibacillus TaxID=185978 RepID=UPI00088A53C4|nr:MULTISPECIES: tRNA glutamyl-Q(34) synthetase GluQRS [unclassified Paenibacillus]SDE10906.1 glutamyl-tRNA synthetase [Paenibacillus sp. cl123]SFW59874.1 glutamyl-tRNA synthetase [Paenibacillus sp. UNCCL117]
MNRRGRFAPTPSGFLHIGNAFTALAAWLQMRQLGGEFVLRIEDIDKSRCRSVYTEQLQDDLLWLGLDWDEGPRKGGPYAPYEQSRRERLYEQALERLHHSGLVYPCYCSRSELSMVGNAPHGVASEGAVYTGACRFLSPAERAVRAARKAPSLRFIMPEREFSFPDGLAGPQCFSSKGLGDFIIKRADGMFSYQLAVTVDDAAMGITDVLRGADLLDSTPRQLALYEALGTRPPSFAHVPLLADAGGRRLSKRDRDLTLTTLRKTGVRPERLLGALAHTAGWLDRPEPVTARDLVKHFKPIRSFRSLLPFSFS